MPSTGPSGFGRNEYYSHHEEYLAAVAEAMREEYLGIVGAGFILQVDDPFLIDMLSDPTMELEERERLAQLHVEALNHALRGIPTEQDPPPHLLRAQPRAAHERHPPHRGRAVHAGDQRRAPTASRSRTPATTTSGASGRTSSCPTARSSSRASSATRRTTSSIPS